MALGVLEEGNIFGVFSMCAEVLSSYSQNLNTFGVLGANILYNANKP
jgi:hypothetical protein